MPEFCLEHRYQDSGWESSGPERLGLFDAIVLAEQRSRNAIAWGMCRVVNAHNGDPIFSFSAGHQPFDVFVDQERKVVQLTPAVADPVAVQHPVLPDSGRQTGGRPLPPPAAEILGDYHGSIDGIVNVPMPLVDEETIAELQRLAGDPSSVNYEHSDEGDVTAAGPDLPPIELRTPRNIRIRENR